jgi:hypothetical protein
MIRLTASYTNNDDNFDSKHSQLNCNCNKQKNSNIQNNRILVK